MLRTILIGLDGSPSCAAARDLGIRWAKQHEAMLFGLGIIDQPTISAVEPVGAVGGTPGRDAVYYVGYGERLAETRAQVRTMLETFAAQCTEANVPCSVHEVEGSPAEQLRLEAQRHDLLLLGRETHFHFATQEKPDHTLRRVIKDGSRPVISVPEDAVQGKEIIVAFDGSPQSSRALYAFVASGLGLDARVEVVSVDCFASEAERTANRAVQFLRSHGIEAIAFSAESEAPPAEILLTRSRLRDAGLIVMGAYGQKAIKEFVFGSVTRTVLEESSVPVFCFN
jgi:nucleotide-binding universal stress UspA family protein